MRSFVTLLQVIVMPYPKGGEVYSIKAPLFDSTYVLEDPQSRVPTYEEVISEWSAVIQNKETIYRKSEVVFIKPAGEHNNPVQKTDAPAELCTIELTAEA